MRRMAGVGGGEEELSQNPEALTWQGAVNPVMSLRLASWIGISWATCVCVCVCVKPARYHAGKNHFWIIFTNHFSRQRGGAEHSGDSTQQSSPLVVEAESDQLYVPAILNADFQFPDGDRLSLELEHIPQLISSENNMYLSWQEFDLGDLKASISSP